MFTAISILFSLWFLISLLYIFSPKSLGRLRTPLYRYGFTANWSVFVPNKGKERVFFRISYADKDEEGSIGEWVEIPKVKWHPLIFLFNKRGRLNSVLTTCTKVLIKMNDNGKKIDQDIHFKYLTGIVCSFKANSKATSRQVKLERREVDSDFKLVAKSEFLSLL